ncbi:efflux RND transporter periplasmic adaptor subunit [Photobacterium sp. DA100]|uniref:efflux RND transporter periplasmic adaptor subunit n=1 Tax=Photobacterium sp. DA100 TaxID=3027472 RepID=UPI0024798378|nr:efflux RND transporter periplasmic adaptor subunit [Photobacterium sp. DA100]WEM43557.1 efflux RND transporter periplasmic adaptor subunit [Photobacterium sp. DA100]
MSMKRIAVTIAAFAGLGILFFTISGGFVAKLDTENLAPPGEALAGQAVVRVQAETLPVWQQYTGSIVADQQATLSARLTAQVADVLVDVGDNVKAGDILIRLDNLDLDARVRQSEQALASAQAQLNIARKDYERTLSLFKRKLIAQSQLDEALSNRQTAEARFKQSQASVEEAQTTYGYSIIAAPFDGVITQKLVHRGDIASPGIPMLSLYNPATLMMESYIAASQRYLLELGQRWPVILPEQGWELEGTIKEITPASDAGSRSVVVKLAFAPELLAQSGSKPLYPGMFARVGIVTGEEQVLMVPSTSTYRIGQLEYIKIVDGDRLVPRLIQTRPYLDDKLIIRKGVTEMTDIVAQPDPAHNGG